MKRKIDKKCERAFHFICTLNCKKKTLKIGGHNTGTSALV